MLLGRRGSAEGGGSSGEPWAAAKRGAIGPGAPAPCRGGSSQHRTPLGLQPLCALNSERRLLPGLLQTNLLHQITCLAGILSWCLSLPPLAVSTVYRQGNRNPMLRNFLLLLLFSFKSASVPDSLSLETT